MKPAFLTSFRFVIAAVALLAAYYSAVFARASYLFQQDTATSVPAAVDLVPFNGSYLARLAAWQPGSKQALLQRAVQLNPFDYESWIQLGLAAEMQQHDLPSAERDYLRAADVNHMFVAKWTLTNFYFRQEEPAKFFEWAKASLQISPYQADPIFTQMWLMSQDADRIAAALPDKPTVLLQYALFLARSSQFTPIPPVVQRLVHLAADGNPSEFGRDAQILPVEDQILAAGQLRPALAIWSTMAKAGWLHLPVPNTAAPLTNGEFLTPFLGHGFDWVESAPAGVTLEQSTSQKTVEITLSGDEPERCVLLQQYVLLQPNKTYRLQWKADAPSMQAPSGVAWHVRPVQSGIGVLSAGDLLTEGSGVWDFQAPPSEVNLLTLEYSRPLGNLRANGSLTLHEVFLEEK